MHPDIQVLLLISQMLKLENVWIVYILREFWLILFKIIASLW